MCSITKEGGEKKEVDNGVSEEEKEKSSNGESGDAAKEEVKEVVKEEVSDSSSSFFTPVSLPLLDPRISRVTLLRRMCQVLGLRVISRNFDYSNATPFRVDDILSVVPLVSTT